MCPLYIIGKAKIEPHSTAQVPAQALESSPQKATIRRLFKVLSILGVKLQLVDNTTPAIHHLSDSVNEQDEW